MSQDNYALLTRTGRLKEAQRMAGQSVPAITHMAFGDMDRAPTGGETALGHEVHRATLTGWGAYADQTAAYFDCYLPASVGGFVIREVGLIDAAGDLVAIARRSPGLPKTTPENGGGDDFTLRIDVFLEDLDTLVVQVSPIAGLTADNLRNFLYPNNLPVEAVLSSAPGAPLAGGQWIVGANPTGIWTGRTGQIARWRGAWDYETPRAGRMASYWTGTRLVLLRYDGAVWAEWRGTSTERGPVYLAPDPLQEADDLNAVTPLGLAVFDRAKRSLDVFFGNGQLLDNSDFSIALRNLAATDQGNGGVPALTFTNSANTYHIDRWRAGAAGVAVNTATADRIAITSGSLKQTMALALRSGTSVTVSARVLAGTLSVTMLGQTKTIVAGARGSVTFTASADVSAPVIEMSGGGAAVTIERSIKAEFGETATPYRARHGAIERQILAIFCQRVDLRVRNTFDASGWTTIVLPLKPIMGGSPATSLVVRSSSGPLSGATGVQSSAASCVSLGVAATGAGEVIAEFTLVSDADFY